LFDLVNREIYPKFFGAALATSVKMNAFRVLCVLLLLSFIYCGAIISVANITDKDFSIVAINPADGKQKVLKTITYELPSHSPIEGTALCNDRMYILLLNDPKKVITYDLYSNEHKVLDSTDYILAAQFSRPLGQLFGVTLDDAFVQLDCQTLKTTNVLVKKLPSVVDQMKSSTLNNDNFVVAATDTTQAALPSTFVNINFKTGAIQTINNPCGYFADLQFDNVRNVNYGILSSLDQVKNSTDRLMRVDTNTGKCEVIAELSSVLNITSGNAIYGSVGIDVDAGDLGSYMFSVYDMVHHVVSTIIFDIKQRVIKNRFNLSGATLGNAQFLRKNL
jgi:hypothetical protein